MHNKSIIKCFKASELDTAEITLRKELNTKIYEGKYDEVNLIEYKLERLDDLRKSCVIDD